MIKGLKKYFGLRMPLVKTYYLKMLSIKDRLSTRTSNNLNILADKTITSSLIAGHSLHV
jgi:hypothetical protein